MSQETIDWLNNNVLVGFTEKRKSPGNPDGVAWHYNKSYQGDESNHYTGAIPVEDVQRRLFSWEPVMVPAQFEWNGITQVTKWAFAINGDTGEVMGCHGEDYVAHSYNQWLISNVSSILDDELQIGSAALLRDGAVAFVTVEVPDNITTPEGVKFRPYLCAVTSLNGSIATTYKRCVTNWVCDNTMSAGLAEVGQEFKVKHTKNSLVRLTDARNALSIVHDIADDFSAEVKRLCETEVSNKMWSEFLDGYKPIPEEDIAMREDKSAVILNKKAITQTQNVRDELNHMYHHDKRVSEWEGTAWGVLQAVNTYANHKSQTRGTIREERNMLSMVTGKFDIIDQEALTVLNTIVD